MPEAPTGTVTLLFTDIEGSTRLLQRAGDAYAGLLDEHCRLLRGVVERHRGYEVDSEGDAFLVVFASAQEAVAAAAEAQQALDAYPWPEGQEIRVRMGLHTGEPRLIEGRYVGIDVHRAARVMAAGHGGQVLLSQSTRELLDERFRLRDLGVHRLKDLSQAQQLYQLQVEGLPSEFPPLTTLENRPTNLPVQPTALIGREQELREVESLLSHSGVRLLTLTGPGGVGKTRLALQVAADLIEAFPDGVFLVSLAPIGDADRVIPAVAQMLGLREQVGEPLIETLHEYLREKRMLLVLDNFEQVVAAASDVSRLLSDTSRLRILVTSRERLKLAAERVYEVAPFATTVGADDPQQQLRSDAVVLFAARARAAGADLSLSVENVGSVAAICARLEGLPLAIELAAARSVVLSPEALLKRLDQRLALLTGGTRDAADRQKTLSNTIEWSYALLSAEEKELFARLAVFVDGCRIEAAEAIFRSDRASTSDVLDQLSALVEKSLLRRREDPDGEPRFWMLDTIRDFAHACLAKSHDVRRRSLDLHRRHYLALATKAERELRGPQQAEQLARLYADLPNLRAALEDALRNDSDGGLAGAAALVRFWIGRGLISEGREWLELTLRERKERHQPEARALIAAAELALEQSDFGTASALARECKTIAAGELGDSLLGQAAVVDGWVAILIGDNYAAAREAALAAIAALEPTGASRALSEAWAILGWSETLRGNWGQAQAHLEEALRVAERSGDVVAAAERLGDLAKSSRAIRSLEEARAQGKRGLILARAMGNRHLAAILLADLAHVSSDEGDAQTALRLSQEATSIFEELGESAPLFWPLFAKAKALRLDRSFSAARDLLEDLLLRSESRYGRSHAATIADELGIVENSTGNPAGAAELWGATARLRNDIGVEPAPDEIATLDKGMEAAREQLGEDAFERAWNVGYQTEPQDFIQFAFSRTSLASG